MKVFLSGEGPDDLGDWYRDPQNRQRPPAVGLVEALLRRVSSVELTVIGACVWKRIRKYRFGRPMEAETRNVLGLMIEADEVGADVLVFIRDQDGDGERGAAVDEGLRLARGGSYTAGVVGGVAVQEIEAWILAMLGERRSERHSNAKVVLEKDHRIGDRASKVAAVEDADLDRIPEDARSLRAWLGQARTALAAES